MCDYSDVKELLEGKNQNVCMDIEKFKERSHPPLPSYSLSDNFDSFLQTAISAILAFVVSLRIFLLATFKRIKSQPEEDLDQPELHIIEESSSSEDSKMSKKQHSNGMPSVMSLLQTDEMPSSCSDDEPTTSEHIPLPSLLQSNMNSLPNFLHTINEEESDELRSLTGSSLASPRTIVENRRLSNISLHSQTSDINQSREQLDKNSQTISIESETKAEELSSDQVKGEKEEAEEEEEEDRFELLKKLANIKKPIETEMTSGHEGIVEPSSTSETIEIERKSKEVRPCSPIQVRLAEQEHIDDVDETQVPEESSDNESEHLEIMRRVVESSEDKPQLAEIVTVQHELADADRDQDEELVFNDERRKTVTMDDSSSLRSASINLESQKGEIDLNESFASNPTDETVLMQQTKDQMDSSSRPQSPLDLPPPPPSVIQAPVHPPVPPPPPPKPNVNIGETTKTWTKSSEPDAKIPVSSLSPAQPPPSILSTTSTSSRTVISNTYPLYTSSTASMSVPTEAPPPPPAPQTGSSYQPHYSSASALNQATSSIGIGSTAPKSISSSREDLLSEHATSRSTVREIPVQRAPSTAPSHTTSVLDYRVMPTTTTSYQHVETPSDEYYRREVMTRTIITRSTEALSQTPIGRSVSPIDRYLPYTTTTTAPDGRTREERTVDYKVTYHRDIEEEERRVREEQARRRQLEQERRTREEESRRIWEQRQREELQRLYNQQAMTERELERSLAERERAEKDRIEKDRLDRQKAEMIRRAEWERLENERIAAEEAELARRRALEKERIEREKAEEERRTLERLQKEKERLEREREEAERKERERLERERIERERIERERIEIERIERIKRERLERERREREKEKEEEERLKREREELERIERERRELEIRERQEYELQRREAEDRERQRLEDEAREMRRREEERREAELLAEVRRQAEERERARKRQEREEAERIERIRLEQQRIDMERAEAERRERERREEERREMELLEAARRKKEMRERERLEEMERERQREEEERRERERREQERYLAAERERQRRQEEEEELARLNELQRAAAQRQAQRDAELERQRERDELDRKARQLSEMEMREKERRERERLQEEAQLAELQEKERRNQEIRDRERREAADREANRQREDRRSRDKLDILVRERSEKEKFEAEKRRLLAEKEAMNKKRNHLLSHETLAKLTQPLYYTSKEPEVTTKVERQVIERIDRNLWVEDMPSSAQTAIGYLDNDENNRDRMYNPNDLGRSGSSRYHRAKMDKARRDFYSSSQDSAELQNDKFRKSIEDISSTRSRQDYRGPLLQKFHESEFRTTTYNDTDGLPYRRMGPSPYEQQNETNTRAESVVAYGRESRRDSPTEASHARSRSADYLMDRKIREETAVPENQLQKSCGGDHSPRESRISEYEMRFRKSTEKLTVPDWYRENKPQATTTTGTTTKSSYRQNEQSQQPTLLTTTTTSTPSAQTVDFTRGMFDKYRDEIEDLRRSRSSLHHTGMEQPQQQNTRQNPSSSLSGIEQTFSHSGYTVSEVPNGWNLQTSQSSRVIEVADTFIGGSLASHEYGNISNRYGGRVTIEEVLDVFFQKAVPRDPYVPIDKSYPQADEVYQGNLDVPCIYTNNNLIMRQVLNHPEKAEHILRNEELYVRCTQCHRTRSLPSARLYFVSCKHCYTYYCSRQCRRQNWSQHSTRCSFARINTLCKDVIMKVREDEDAQAYMSKVAREGFSSGGRGSVNIRLSSPQIAQAYVTNGWRALNAIPLDQLLYYYTIAALEQEKKEPSLIALCRRYEPHEKFILSVSIIADIEHCPETPPPETRELSAPRFESVRNPPFFSNIAHEV